jgi:hypothetical protein
MQADRFEATYLIETPLAPEKVAEVMAGEQSCGTFTRVEGETDELRLRARATVEQIDELESVNAPSLPNALLERKGHTGPWRRARVRISFPVANVGANLPTLAATVSGNLYDLGEASGLRLESLQAAGRLSRLLRHAACRHRRHTQGHRRGKRRAGRHHHQAQRRLQCRADRRARRAPVRRRCGLHQGRRGLRQPGPCAAGPTRAGRDGRGARPPAAHRQTRDGGLQHHRRNRRDETPCRPGRAKAAVA